MHWMESEAKMQVVCKSVNFPLQYKSFHGGGQVMRQCMSNGLMQV